MIWKTFPLLNLGLASIMEYFEALSKLLFTLVIQNSAFVLILDLMFTLDATKASHTAI